MSPGAASRGAERHAPQTWRYHLSVDDVFESLIHLADSGKRLLEEPLFEFLGSLHEDLGAEIELYIFEQAILQGRPRSLQEVPDSLRRDFAGLPWLRLGPHAQSYEKVPFEQPLDEQLALFERLQRQIDRIAGPPSRARWLRLHYFSECYEAAPALRAQGIESLLLTDRSSVAYRLEEQDRLQLERTGALQRHGLTLRRSFPRIEGLLADSWSRAKIETAFRARLEQHGYLALFTHEVELKRPEVREMAVRCLEVLGKLGARTKQDS